MMTRVCPCCKVEKPVTEFYKSTKDTCGVASRCKVCDREYHSSDRRKQQKKRAHVAWYAKNGAKYLEGKRTATKIKRLKALEEKVKVLGALDNSRKVAWRKGRAQRSLYKAQAQPIWVDEAHHHRIAAIYAATQQLQELTGAIYHVDHIVPLKADMVCGLHVWWNLQPMPEKMNILKNNIFDPTIFPEQGEVAFPSGGGLSLVQNTMPATIVEENDE